MFNWLKRKIDKWALNWCLKRRVFQSLNGDWCRIISKNARKYIEDMINIASDAKFHAVILQRNSWDKDMGDKLLNELDELYDHIYAEKDSIDGQHHDKRFIEVIIKKSTEEYLSNV